MASNRTKNTKIEPEEKIDRISSLPDPIIHHILSFLPSTSYAVRTCVLSKRWRYQWTRVPALIFDESIPAKHFSTYISSALLLHDSPTISKFVVKTHDMAGLYSPQSDSLFPVWIRLAMRKQVKELTLDFGYTNKLRIPEFFFSNDSLEKFEASGLDFSSCGKVNWPSLKVLSVEFCNGVDKAIGNIVSGSPLLESLQFMCINWNVCVVIASASLKRLIVMEPVGDSDDYGAALEIACPYLEELELFYTFWIESVTLVDFPSSPHVTLHLRDHHYQYLEGDLEADENNLLRILRSVKHVDVLSVGVSFFQVFSIWVVVRSLSPPLMNSKCLTLNVADFDRGLPGFVSLLRNSPGLEKLIINFEQFDAKPLELESYDFGEKYWNLQKNVLNLSMSHLKTIEIFGLMRWDWEDQHKLILRFLKFLVENSKLLEEISIFRRRMTKEKSCNCISRVNFAPEHFDSLLSLQRCYPGVNVSVSCCKAYAIASRNGASQV